jgi:hypothetical protein
MSRFLNEKKINGLDAKELLSNKPEAKVTQLHTLQDIISEAEDDEVFQTIVNETNNTQVRDHSSFGLSVSLINIRSFFKQNVGRKTYDNSPSSQRRTSFLKIPGRSANFDLESAQVTASRPDSTSSFQLHLDSRRPSQQLKVSLHHFFVFVDCFN